MYLNNIVTFYRIKRGVEPESVIHLFSAPEEEPEHFVFEIKYADDISHWVATQTEGSLMVREIAAPKEIDVIKAAKPSKMNTEEVETL